jgi:hypothetical protein
MNRPRYHQIPTVAQVEHILGWRWGFLCGLVAGAMAVGVVWGLVSH